LFLKDIKVQGEADTNQFQYDRKLNFPINLVTADKHDLFTILELFHQKLQQIHPDDSSAGIYSRITLRLHPLFERRVEQEEFLQTRIKHMSPHGNLLKITSESKRRVKVTVPVTITGTANLINRNNNRNYTEYNQNIIKDDPSGYSIYYSESSDEFLREHVVEVRSIFHPFIKNIKRTNKTKEDMYRIRPRSSVRIRQAIGMEFLVSMVRDILSKNQHFIFGKNDYLKFGKSLNLSILVNDIDMETYPFNAKSDLYQEVNEVLMPIDSVIFDLQIEDSKGKAIVKSINPLKEFYDRPVNKRTNSFEDVTKSWVDNILRPFIMDFLNNIRVVDRNTRAERQIDGDLIKSMCTSIIGDYGKSKGRGSGLLSKIGDIMQIDKFQVINGEIYFYDKTLSDFRYDNPIHIVPLDRYVEIYSNQLEVWLINSIDNRFDKDLVSRCIKSILDYVKSKFSDNKTSVFYFKAMTNMTYLVYAYLTGAKKPDYHDILLIEGYDIEDYNEMNDVVYRNIINLIQKFFLDIKKTGGGYMQITDMMWYDKIEQGLMRDKILEKLAKHIKSMNNESLEAFLEPGSDSINIKLSSRDILEDSSILNFDLDFRVNIIKRMNKHSKQGVINYYTIVDHLLREVSSKYPNLVIDKSYNGRSIMMTGFKDYPASSAVITTIDPGRAARIESKRIMELLRPGIFNFPNEQYMDITSITTSEINPNEKLYSGSLLECLIRHILMKINGNHTFKFVESMLNLSSLSVIIKDDFDGEIPNEDFICTIEFE
jgi:hypothetical protein